MSRLDSFIRRMTAQRDILDHLSGCLDGIPGAIYELGLGSGRTFDHLRERFPGRRLVAFESVPCAHVVAALAPVDLVIGDLRHTAQDFPNGSAALIHLDLAGSGPAGDVELRAWLTPLVVRLLAPNGYVVSDLSLEDRNLIGRPLPPGVAPGRYYLAQRHA